VVSKYYLERKVKEVVSKYYLYFVFATAFPYICTTFPYICDNEVQIILSTKLGSIFLVLTSFSNMSYVKACSSSIGCDHS
jgi:hypothetical protein